MVLEELEHAKPAGPKFMAKLKVMAFLGTPCITAPAKMVMEDFVRWKLH